MLLAALRHRYYAHRVSRLTRLFLSGSSPGSPARRRDVFGAYRIAFGRDPDSEAIIAGHVGQPTRQMLQSFLSSDEFRVRVRDRLLAGGTLHGARFDAPPSRIVRRWCASRLPLSLNGRVKLITAKSWPDLYIALFGDAHFTRTIFDGNLTGRDLTMVHLLKSRQHGVATTDLIGEIEIVTPHEVRGWAFDQSQAGRGLDLQLWIGDRLVATTLATLFRPDLQSRFGGAAQIGFCFHCGGGLAGRAGEQAEIRAAASMQVVARFIVEEDHRAHSGIVEQMRRELDELRGVLDRIEAKLPALHSAYGFSLDDWDAYFATFYGATRNPKVTMARTARPIAVIIDTEKASPSSLGAALASVAEQSLLPSQVIVVHRGPDDRLGHESELNRWRDRFPTTTSLILLVTAAHDDATTLQTAATAVTSEHIALLPAFATLAPDALELTTHELADGARFVYADEDSIVSAPGTARNRHTDPLLLGVFDPDLFFQQGVPGWFAACTRDHLSGLPSRSAGLAAVREALCRSAYEQAGRSAIVHIPRVLCHSAMPAEATSYSIHYAEVGEHLARLGIVADVEPHVDPCGAVVVGAARIRFPAKENASIAIIIPTRDRLDLLRPCVASIQASLPANRAHVQTIIVDNRSESDETRSYLDAVRLLPGTRVVAHDDAFNWALINNRAASTVTADVLVFLNNDTSVLTPDCWDELAAQAMRPDVGAVGARLLYNDGTIQHAGIVLDPWHSFASHEAVGMAASDPGYLSRNSLVREVSAVTGACLATRTEIFRTMGGFDERFPIEGNDTDYCLRLRNVGLRILYDPFVTLYHFESKSRGLNDTDAKRATADAATALLRARWAEQFQADPFYNPHFDRLALPFTRLQALPRG